MRRRRESLLDSLVVLLARMCGRRSGLANVRNLPWQHFQMLAGEAFRRRGFTVETTGRCIDSVIDLVLRKEERKLLVQCSHRKVFKVGARHLRQLHGVMAARNASGAYFLSSSAYTEDARSFARERGIELIDGPALQQMIFDAQSPEPFMDPTVGRRGPNTGWHG